VVYQIALPLEFFTTALALLLMHMEANTLESSGITNSTDRALSSIPVELSTLGISRIVNSMDKAYIPMQMGL
tara:strand:- start:516 stop:731 length:216 start_codon:yes stop_codon:yes gene_type:complete